jgi:hypothetical protein
MTARSKGYVLLMWTGLIEGADGLPRMFRTAHNARQALAKYPSWGHAAVSVRRCTRRDGADGRPEYIIGEVVSQGMVAW